MELTIDSHSLLKQFAQAAFIVEDGAVVDGNQHAENNNILVGQTLTDILTDGLEQYTAFGDGYFCMTLKVNDLAYDASVLRTGNRDVVILSSKQISSELSVLATAARSLREPLTSAMIATQELQSNLDEGERLQHLSKSLARLHRDITNMADAGNLSKVRTGKMMTYDLVSVLSELVEKAAVQLSLTKKRLQFKTPCTSVDAVIDKERLERAILNLISNALKYSAGNEPVTIRLDRNDNRVQISVINHTVSTFEAIYHELSAAYLKEPSFHTGGIGLGMTIVKNVAMAHGGTLLFDQPQENTLRVTLSFPIRFTGNGKLHTSMLYPVDYLGGYDHTLIELADILPPEAFV